MQTNKRGVPYLFVRGDGIVLVNLRKVLLSNACCELLDTGGRTHAGSQPLTSLHARGCSMCVKILLYAGVATIAIVMRIGSM